VDKRLFETVIAVNKNKIVIKILQGNVVTQIMLGGLTTVYLYLPVAIL